jgi:6-methylsalicylate decarboxylase
MRIDVHQHIWTESLIDRLAARDVPPMVRRCRGLTVLHCNGEQPYVIDTVAEEPQRRARLVRQDGLDLALIAISSPVGIEALPRRSARELIGAHLDGVRALPDRFAAWGPMPLDGISADDVDDVLARGCVGVSLPAGALGGVVQIVRMAPVLERIALRRVPLFVHPGPGLVQRQCEAELDEPSWWRALTAYVAQMHAAWLTFTTSGRRQHPELVVLFAMLAGCAPLLCERLDSRGGPPVDLRDPRIFYETSSYGPAAVEMMATRVGAGQLLYGSDRPVIEPVATGRELLLQVNGAGHFAGIEVPA